MITAQLSLAKSTQKDWKSKLHLSTEANFTVNQQVHSQLFVKGKMETLQ